LSGRNAVTPSAPFARSSDGSVMSLFRAAASISLAGTAPPASALLRKASVL
jgi:hypothetical protein